MLKDTDVQYSDKMLLVLIQHDEFGRNLIFNTLVEQ